MMRSLDPKPRKAYLDKMMNIHSQKEKIELWMEGEYEAGKMGRLLQI